MNILFPTMKGSVMGFRGKRYVKTFTDAELNKPALGKEESIAEYKRGLGELCQFIKESHSGSSKSELTTDRPFSFTLYEDILRKDRVKYEVKLPVGTKLSFFTPTHFIFDVEDYCLAINLDTGNVVYHQQNVARRPLNNASSTQAIT